jgi:hypothetical protein
MLRKLAKILSVYIIQTFSHFVRYLPVPVIFIKIIGNYVYLQNHW